MKRFVAFLKTTTLGGLFVLLPIVVVGVILTRIVLATRKVAQSAIATLVGRDPEWVPFPLILAILIVVGVSFLLGLALISRSGRSTSGWVERKLLVRLPGYRAARAIIGGLINPDRDGVMKPGLLSLSDGADCFVFITEVHPDGRLTIYLPNSPNPGAGDVRIVDSSLVRPLHAPIPEIAGALQEWGVGSAAVLTKAATPSAASGATQPAPEQLIRTSTR
jgi:uncharacterized membrane protein